MDWDIDPPAVGKVLQTTAQQATAFEGHAKEYADYAQQAVTGAQATFVGQAVVEVLTFYKDAWRDIADQIDASLTGAKDATVAYLNGQHEMALNAQRNATDAAGKRQAAEAKAARQRKRGYRAE
jgi:hypothetical protein